MNRVILIGRLVRDPETRTTINNTNVTRFTIAVARKYQNDDGEKQADFINCVAFNKLANNIAKYCIKGSQVAVEGRIQTGNYEDQNGTTRYTTDIMCDNVKFLGNKKNKEEATDNNVADLEEKEDPFAEFEMDDSDLPWLNEEENAEGNL